MRSNKDCHAPFSRSQWQKIKGHCEERQRRGNLIYCMEFQSLARQWRLGGLQYCSCLIYEANLLYGISKFCSINRATTIQYCSCLIYQANSFIPYSFQNCQTRFCQPAKANYRIPPSLWVVKFMWLFFIPRWGIIKRWRKLGFFLFFWFFFLFSIDL